jgi:uncharacterized protein YjbJ (UPF0337 family)
MGGRIDKAKGRTKKAAGELADDPGLKDRGRLDKASGSIKRGVDKAKDKAKDARRKS